MIAIYDWFGYEIPSKRRYELIKEAGFDGVLLWWSEHFGRGCDYREGPKLAREAGLIVENIHAPIHLQDDLWLDNLAGEAAVELYLQSIEDCAAFEIPAMVVHLPDNAYVCNALGLERIRKISDRAEARGVNVAMENLRNYTNLTCVLEQVDSPRIGFCYDSGHHYRNAPDKDLLGMYGSRLMAIHLHDDNGSWGQHGMPMDGSLDWPKIMREIQATGYTGSTGIEIMNWDYEHLSAEEFLHAAFECGRKLEALHSGAKESAWAAGE